MNVPKSILKLLLLTNKDTRFSVIRLSYPNTVDFTSPKYLVPPAECPAPNKSRLFKFRLPPNIGVVSDCIFDLDFKSTVLALAPSIKTVLSELINVLNCKVATSFCLNITAPVPKLTPLFMPPTEFNRVKFALTLVNATLRSSPVPSFAYVPKLIVCNGMFALSLVYLPVS